MLLQVQRGGEGVALIHLQRRRQKNVGGQHQVPAALSPGKTGVHHIGGWVGPSAALDNTQNPAPPEFDPRTVQPVAGRYTD